MKTVNVCVIMTIEFDETEFGDNDMLEGLSDGIRASFLDDIEVTDVCVTEVLNESNNATEALKPAIKAYTDVLAIG